MQKPRRGEVWQAEDGAVSRPVVIVSDNELNHSRAGLVITVPISFTEQKIPSHIRTKPPEGGLHQQSFIQCELLHTIPQSSLTRHLGALHPATLFQVEDCLKLLLGF